MSAVISEIIGGKETGRVAHLTTDTHHVARLTFFVLDNWDTHSRPTSVI